MEVQERILKTKLHQSKAFGAGLHILEDQYKFIVDILV